MTKNELFLDNLKYMNKIMLQDTKEGKVWKYRNSGKKYGMFQDCRAKNHRYLNCVDGPQMALKGPKDNSRVVPNNACSWYGGQNKGPVWLNGSAEKNAKKYFDIFWYNGKYSVSQLVKKRMLCPSDILVGFREMNHTCCFYSYDGGGKSFDSGHAYAKGSGEGAVMTKWIGGLSAKSAHPMCVFRLKDRKHYIVQAGSYRDINKAKEFQADLKKRFGIDTSLQKIGEENIVCLGKYDCIENAQFYMNHYVNMHIVCVCREV